METEVLSEGMEINYELKNLDYIDSCVQAAKSNLGAFTLDVLVTGSLFMVGLSCCIFGYSHIAIGTLLIGGLLMVLVWLYMIKRIYCWQTIRLPHELKNEKDTITLRLFEEGLEYQNLEEDFQMAWKLFSHILEERYRLLLIFRSGKIFLIVPKRAFVDEQHLHKARQYFEIITNSIPVAPPIAKPQ